ncbi:hypothetical protein ACFFV7_42080 [Nonomuraea spiralis]|uniref:Uncharacterized protein n=1 Tax=Nonomuraea spiralis TaxID=46182 RepID=A0ABV5IU71_9ACTN|nr:hypothetical protein [Nonomuraea spiralis]
MVSLPFGDETRNQAVHWSEIQYEHINFLAATPSLALMSAPSCAPFHDLPVSAG